MPRARRASVDPGRRAAVRLRRNRGRIGQGAVELGLWALLMLLLLALSRSLWRVAQLRLEHRPLSLQLAFPAVAVAAAVFCAVRVAAAWRELRMLRGEQRRLRSCAPEAVGPEGP